MRGIMNNFSDFQTTEGAASNLSDYWIFGWLLGSTWVQACEFVYLLYSFYYALFGTKSTAKLPPQWYTVLADGIKNCDATFVSTYY